jgi:hypothetical protein
LPAGGEQAGIEGRFALVLFHDFLALIEDAFDGVALLAARWLAEQIEYLLQAPDLAFRLVMMFFECRPKLVGVGRLGHLRQRLIDLLFGVIDVLERIKG